MPPRFRTKTFRLRRRFALAAAVLVLSASVILAHSAMAAGHMGGPVAVCIAVAETAGLALLGRTTTNLRAAAALVIRPSRPRDRGPRRAAARPAGPPWPRGSPFALQVLRL